MLWHNFGGVKLTNVVLQQPNVREYMNEREKIEISTDCQFCLFRKTINYESI